MKKKFLDGIRDLADKFRGEPERPRKTAGEFFAAAELQAKKGEYAVAVSQFRQGLRKLTAEDGIDAHKKFFDLWSTIESHAVVYMGTVPGDAVQNMQERVAVSVRGGRAPAAAEALQDGLYEMQSSVDNLKMIKDCMALAHDMFFSKENLTDANLEKLQKALTPKITL